MTPQPLSTDGVQEGFTQPVALIIPGDPNQINILSQAGYRFFTSIDSLRAYLVNLAGVCLGVGAKEVKSSR